jgi:Rieske Fe-S protein
VGRAVRCDAHPRRSREPGPASDAQRGDAEAAPGAVEELGKGEAAVFQSVRDEDPIAAYRDDQGELHLVAATCTHLGCQVQWNNGDRTWDCECHGSTFEPDGTIIHGPAVRDLEPVAVE